MAHTLVEKSSLVNENYNLKDIVNSDNVIIKDGICWFKKPITVDQVAWSVECYGRDSIIIKTGSPYICNVICFCLKEEDCNKISEIAKQNEEYRVLVGTKWGGLGFVNSI